jgi:hypothetical protein
MVIVAGASRKTPTYDRLASNFSEHKMGNVIHKTVPIQVWAEVDEGIADMVRYLNTIPGVRTHSSCQGTIGEGGPEPYPPYVMVTWDSDETLARLKAEFDMSDCDGECEGQYGCASPRTSTN